MATITASMFMALDGVVDPGVGNWHFPYYNDEMGAAVERTHDTDVMVFGRVTYDSFAGAWPGREAAGAGGRNVRQAPGRHAKNRCLTARSPSPGATPSSFRRPGRRGSRTQGRPFDPADRSQRLRLVGAAAA